MSQNIPMATRIEDLPGPSQLEHPPSNIVAGTANVSKKRVSFADETDNRSLWVKIKDEINEENALIAILIFASALPSVTSHFKSIPILGPYASNDVMTGIVSAGILMLVYIIAKIYVLPQIKL